MIFFTHEWGKLQSQNFASCWTPLLRSIEFHSLASWHYHYLRGPRMKTHYQGRLAIMSLSLAVWLSVKNPGKVMSIWNRMSGKPLPQQNVQGCLRRVRWRQHMLPLHPWQKKFKRHFAQRHSSSPSKVISQLSTGWHSDISTVHRHGDTIKVVKRKQFANETFPNIISLKLESIKE